MVQNEDKAIMNNGSINDIRSEEQHDLNLSDWGPYTKRYIGISHIPEPESGKRFDLSVFPGFYRRGVTVPNVMWESGYHPWEASTDLSYVSHRHQILWKDQVYSDISFCRLNERAVLICCKSVNRTRDPQNIVFHYLASLHFPPKQTYSYEVLRLYRVDLPEGWEWIDGLEYVHLTLQENHPRRNLSPDGIIWGEVRDHGFTGGAGLGMGFGKASSDAVQYRLSGSAAGVRGLLVRYRIRRRQSGVMILRGALKAEVVLEGTGGFETRYLRPETDPRAGGIFSCAVGNSTETEIDGFAIQTKLAGSDSGPSFEPVVQNPVPHISSGPRENSVILEYQGLQHSYGIAWDIPAVIRQFFTNDLDCLMRHNVHEHNHTEFRGEGNGHFTDIFTRPLFLEPESETLTSGMVCTGTSESVREALAHYVPGDPGYRRTQETYQDRTVRFGQQQSGESSPGEVYAFSIDRLAATLLSNVVYPVRIQGRWVRHHTPGRWWDCLYTWDSGFIGLGFTEIDLDRAVENLNAYLTAPGNRDAAFIHHGSPVPVQFYLFQAIYSRTGSKELLHRFFPRLLQYHRFIMGRHGSSATRTLKSGLLKTWDYFYNSGGWDDYCPQVYVRNREIQSSTTPVVTSAHGIRTAKILFTAAELIGESTEEFQEDIKSLADALQRYSWDPDSGYFGYVCHDSSGMPKGVLRHESGVNFNMGFDGVYPLVAGICTPSQEELLISRLFSADHMWTPYGLTAVDKSAPYYRDDGYWNGSVWMSHQWFFWKTMLDLGRLDDAYRIASTALNLWKRAVEDSYNCYEHFVAKTGKGAGWHHFGGLSAPVLNWYCSYYSPGRISLGHDGWVTSFSFDGERKSLRASLKFFPGSRHHPGIIVTMNPGVSTYQARWNGKEIPYTIRDRGSVEVSLPSGCTEGCLEIAENG